MGVPKGEVHRLLGGRVHGGSQGVREMAKADVGLWSPVARLSEVDRRGKVLYCREGGFRARRLCAEQGSLGNRSRKPKRRKGGVAMANHVFSGFVPAALTVFSWVCFGAGVLIVGDATLTKVALLALAGVLP